MKKHYYWLDLIRFLAALLVVLVHLRGSSFVEYGLLPDSEKNIFTIIFYSFLRLGHEAVLVFFVMSGFLVGGKTLEKTFSGSFNVKDYAIDRTVRIGLPLIVALILIIVINSIIDVKSNYIELMGNLFSLQGIFVSAAVAPLWSLSYEVWFYILFGALCHFFDITNKNKMTSLMILLICFAVFIKLNYVYLFLWLIGALIYFYKPIKKSRYNLIGYSFLTIVLLIGLQLTSDTRSINVGFVKGFLNKDVMSILFSFSFGLFLTQIIDIVPKRVFFVKLDSLGTKLASFSYTLYLTHYSLIYLFEYLGFPKSSSINCTSLSLYGIQIIICIVFAYLVYLLFEKHTSLLKNIIKAKF